MMPFYTPLNPYIHPTLDRAAHRRLDEAWIARLLEDTATVVLPVWRSKHLVAGPPEAPQPVALSVGESWWRDLAGETALLGIAGGTAYFAVDVSAVADPEEEPRLAALGTFADLRSFGPLLPQEDGAILAYARGLLWWHQRHRFCGVCGHPTVSQEAGHRRRCTDPDCATLHFPRTDPAVIMLVHDGDRCLLGRQATWPKGTHSVLAGFVEPGESLETAVAREVFEEAGIRVADVRYHSSQPWPFPQSLMVGFYARAETTEILCRDDELEDCAWYDRDFLRSIPKDAAWGVGDFSLPRRDSVSRRLIEDWLAADG
ncbi:MAG TPA: NAD(+) diphosphatase [Alphaproteobacteria bacterium]|nr:NAD(+) diphosphatase [Alphaproteobacteria bacterium]